MTINEIMMSLEIGLIYGIVAIGVYLTFRIINFSDLTCDGSFVLGAAVSTISIKSGISSWLAIFIAMLGGSIAGCMTGFLYAKLKITDLLAGILVSFMLYSINLRIMGGVPNISLLNNDTLFGTASAARLFIISAIMCGAIIYLLSTDFGLALRSIGYNKTIAKNNGINVVSVTIIGLALSNAIIALGGALFSQHQSFADIGNGVGTIIVSLAAITISERIIKHRAILVRVISCLLGAIIYRLFISFALYSDILGLTTSDLNLVTGIMIIAIMYIPRSQRKVLC